MQKVYKDNQLYGLAKARYMKWGRQNKVITEDTVAMERKQKMAKARKKLLVTEAKEQADIINEARRHTMQLLQVAIDIANDPGANDASRLSAVNFVHDRAYGKASQTHISASMSLDGKPKDISAADLNKRIADALKRIEGATSRAGKAGSSEERPADLRERDGDTGGSTKH